jgi:hypothetical protein
VRTGDARSGRATVSATGTAAVGGGSAAGARATGGADATAGNGTGGQCFGREVGAGAGPRDGIGRPGTSARTAGAGRTVVRIGTGRDVLEVLRVRTTAGGGAGTVTRCGGRPTRIDRAPPPTGGAMDTATLRKRSPARDIRITVPARPVPARTTARRRGARRRCTHRPRSHRANARGRAAAGAAVDSSRRMTMARSYPVRRCSLIRWLIAVICSTHFRRSRCSRCTIWSSGQWKWNAMAATSSSSWSRG